MNKKLVCIFLVVAMLLCGCESFDGVETIRSTAENSAEELKEKYYQSVGMILNGAPEIVPTVSQGEYAYSKISEEEKLVYDQIYNCIINFQESVVVSTKDTELLTKAHEAVFCDHGDLFWINGYTIKRTQVGSEVVSLQYVPSYTITEEQKDYYFRQCDTICDEWLEQAPWDGDDYSKAKYVYELLINNVEYDINSENNQNFMSVFLNRSTVCQGYCCAAWYMLKKLGISSQIITGTANFENHAWNLIELNGKKYYMDITFGKSEFDEGQQTVPYIRYAYLAMNTTDMEATHTSLMNFELPECTAMDDNYFVRSGYYFEKYDEYEVGMCLKLQYEKGKEFSEIKFATEEAMDEAVASLILKQNITGYIKHLKAFHYKTDYNNNVLTIHWNR